MQGKPSVRTCFGGRRRVCKQTCEKSIRAVNRKLFDERIIGADGPERSFEPQEVRPSLEARCHPLMEDQPMARGQALRRLEEKLLARRRQLLRVVHGNLHEISVSNETG